MTAFDKTAIYMRLSRDDEKAGESVSIEHQRMLLRKYVADRGGKVVDEYIDDGWSGTNFERPAVKRLLEDAQAGRIDTIVVKDLSRFGRNYIQVGQYIDYIFPAYGIRFIAINDHVDTSDRCSAAMDMMPIMNVFNEWHAANTSKKIRTVLEAGQRSGKYTGWNYPYGYRAGTDENRTAAIDGEAAEVVRRIFCLRAEGNSLCRIARILTDDGVPNPAAYFTRLDGGKGNRRCLPRWCPSTVAGILSDPTYVGTTVQHKTTSVSYKNHKTVKVPESERIVKENAHEAIIDLALWNRVQDMKRSASRGKVDRSDRLHALSGLLVCPDCGKKLKLKTSNRIDKNTNARKCGFVCRTYADLGKKYCTSHGIAEREIEDIVLRDIRSMLPSFTVDEKKVQERFLRERANRQGRAVEIEEKRLRACKSRLIELDRLIQTAFEDRVLNNMPESVCAGLCDRYLKERSALEEEISKAEKKRSESSADDFGFAEYVRKLKRYGGCEILTRELCLLLIEFITVGEKSGADGGREIHIFYRLAGE